MVSFEMDDRKKIGLGLTMFGVFVTFLGIIFLFDKGLLAMGNVDPVYVGIGIDHWSEINSAIFHETSKLKGTISFGAGFFFVTIGWPILGMLLESYGFIVLFSGFWPTVVVFLQRIPILGWVFQLPFIRSLLDKYRRKRVPA